MPPVHRLIYAKHFGPIPVDDDGMSYDIHHKDGNRANNDINNLVALTLQEHYDIHFSQGDWMACNRILKRKGNDPAEKSKLLSLSNRQRVENGTHNFQNIDWIRDRQERRSHTWRVTFPGGTSVIVKNLKEFCKHHNLNQGAMNQVGLGRTKHHKGFKCEKIFKGEIRGKECK